MPILRIFQHLFESLLNFDFGFTLSGLKVCPRPWLTFWMLIWPLPWKYGLPTPLDPLEIRDHPDIVHQRYYLDEDYRRLRSFRLFHHRDTPLRSLYRLHDVLCANEDNYVMLEGDYFFRRAGWRTKDIPDPKDPNPLRYAILASLVESMVESFNYKISKGLRREMRMTTSEENHALYMDPNKPFEQAPSWTSHVPPLEEWTSFLEDRVIVIENTPFCKRRICADANQLENV
ncbi:hypothetical protein M413DRAFT_447801 [Hebeloma cylindrosporum]|uniref:Uncharacterized protein n=1 Tax=Hebeloma cylindrosporum TaxID=76867 RepID=A0A0C3C2X9_HEBCY|nr:hypothetical protein M413DRAFT_447801 [Hebeloma cylindrosporum h7]